MIMIMSIGTIIGLGLHGFSNCFGILQVSTIKSIPINPLAFPGPACTLYHIK